MMDNKTSLVDIKGYITDMPETEEAKAIAAANKNRDLMYIRFELCHANTNRNKDTFTSEDLQNSYMTAVAKPIAWGHTNELIGHIYHSEYVPFEGAEGSVDTNTDKIVCDGVVYKFRFPARAREIKNRYDAGKLFFSMETYFDKAKCSQCQAEFSPDGPYCEHLAKRYSPDASASRILVNPLFTGVGCVENPADDARGLAVASTRFNIVPLMEALGSRFDINDYITYMDLVRTAGN